MFVLIMEIMKTAIQFLTDLLSGNLPKYFYLWCGLFMLFVIIYAYLEVRMKYKSADFIKGICIESVSQLAGWIIGILVARLSGHIIKGGITPHDDLDFYSDANLIATINADSASG